jgi:hypothetical protein
VANQVVRSLPLSPVPLTEGQAEKLEHFVMDVAERGCRVIHSGYPKGWSCIDVQDDALAAQRGESSRTRWSSEGSMGAWRDRVAAGERLCRGCRARRVLEGNYYLPGDKEVGLMSDAGQNGVHVCGECDMVYEPCTPDSPRIPDPCLGHIPGVSHACCGHGGVKEAYVVLGGRPNEDVASMFPKPLIFRGHDALMFFDLIHRGRTPEEDKEAIFNGLLKELAA